jgi:hypothetical protein
MQFRVEIANLGARLGLTFTFSSWYRPGSCTAGDISSFHACGTAADIAAINGQSILDRPFDETVLRTMNEALRLPGIAEVFGPFYLAKTDRWGGPVRAVDWVNNPANRRLRDQHMDHIHIAVWPQQYQRVP